MPSGKMHMCIGGIGWLIAMILIEPLIRHFLDPGFFMEIFISVIIIISVIPALYGSLMPDIDHPKSILGSTWWGGLARAVWGLKHRKKGQTHTLWFSLVYALICAVVLIAPFFVLLYYIPLLVPYWLFGLYLILVYCGGAIWGCYGHVLLDRWFTESDDRIVRTKKRKHRKPTWK